ncbi:MAG TPA: hypothetical protein VEP90_21515, partial [Methylomirabilota bacterium]|nr:hypothetical protein [Methylomirabilota bacterium]
VFCSTASARKLAILHNLGVLEDEADKSGNNATKIWEWKKNKKASYLETAHWLSTYACVNLRYLQSPLP